MKSASRWDRIRLRRAAACILARGLEAADPQRLVRRNLSVERRRRGSVLKAGGRRYALGRGRIVLVAVGKAAVPMARATETALGDTLAVGIAVTNVPASSFERTVVRVAGHPVPDAAGLAAAQEVERLLQGLTARDLVIVMLSGGASALLPAPVSNVSLEDKAATTALLLRSGATIRELNVVRKHLSRLKGGGLARAAAPARVACLVLSDVVGDDVSTIGSGPAVPDPSTFADALSVLTTRGLLDAIPRSVRLHLEAGERGEFPETPKPGAPDFRRVDTHVIGGNRLSLDASAREARRLGLRTLILTSHLEGEAREVGRALVAILRECVVAGRPLRSPACLLVGGETTVTVKGGGTGGRNQELVLATIDPLADMPAHAVVVSLATDGVDGNSHAAGGAADQESAQRARELGLAPPVAFLSRNDSTSFLATLGDLIVTGPTGTNVADITLLLAGNAL